MIKKLTIVSLMAIVLLFVNCKKTETEPEITGNVQYSVMVVPTENSGMGKNSIIKKGKTLLKTKGDLGGSVSNKSVAANADLSGTIITIKQNGNTNTYTLASEDNGTAVFRNIISGSVAVSIVFPNNEYTNVDFVADLASSNPDDIIYNASTMIPVFPLTGSSLSEIKGKVTFESDLTNLTPETSANIKVSASIDVNDLSFVSTYLSNNSGPGNITKIAYHSIVMSGNTDANGDYSIKVPSTANGLPYKLIIPDFQADQTLLMNTVNGQIVEGMQSISTLYSSVFDGVLDYPSTVPNAPGAYIHFGTPTGTIAGNTVMTQATAFIWHNSLTGVIDSVKVNNQGSGYSTAPNIIITDLTHNGHGATATATINQGKVTNISLTNQGSGYINPKVDIIYFQSGFTAKGRVNIDMNGVINNVTLLDANNNPASVSGMGYVTEPTVSIIPAIAGVGSGASAKAIINSSGQIMGVNFSNKGGGYFAKNHPEIAMPFQVIPYNSISAESGNTYIRNIYLGTGKRIVEN
ncbi:MAG TPA: hypothetical protein PKN48_03075 [Bacteroidales bacterium]|nr:hypothetical protein [Bacteroidales bacterium]